MGWARGRPGLAGGEHALRKPGCIAPQMDVENNRSPSFQASALVRGAW